MHTPLGAETRSGPPVTKYHTDDVIQKLLCFFARRKKYWENLWLIFYYWLPLEALESVHDIVSQSQCTNAALLIVVRFTEFVKALY